MKLEVWAKECLSELNNSGFLPHKKHEFFRITADVFHSISFQGNKKDIYIWYNALPIALPTFWPSSGWGQAAGRIPEEENMLFITQEKDIPSVQQKLAELNKKSVIPHLESLKNIEDLDACFDISNSPSSAYPKAICKFMLGEYEQGREIIDVFVNYKIQKLKEYEVKNPYSELDRPEYFIGLSNDQIYEELLNFKRNNIKKYRLKKYQV